MVGGHPMRLHPIFATLNLETVEFASYRAFAAAIHRGDVVYDVGAFIGTYTIIALQKAGPLGRVIAFEPSEVTREHLVRHLEWNGCKDRTIVREVCCGAVSGERRFYFLPGKLEAVNGLVPVEGFDAKQVPVTSLDTEVANTGWIPAVVKIDVEGAEWDVLKGAEYTLQQYRPRLFISLHPAPLAKLGATANAVLDWLVEHEYEWKIIEQDHEVHVQAQPC
jgi:FkbM family methyltransferase